MRIGLTASRRRARAAAWAAAALLGVCVARAPALAAGPEELVKVQSASYTDFRQVLAGETPTSTVTVPATLRFPSERKDRYAAVVVVHTIGGYQEANEGWHATELRHAGFATLTYDSFAARGMSRAAVLASSTGPPLASAVADAFAALGALVNHPRIDADRVAIAGFSFGGEVAHLAALGQLRSVLARGSGRFAAHVAWYPAGVYGVMAGPGAYTGAPILMLLGGKDDNLPVSKVEGYVAYARAAGHAVPVDLVVYPDAHHAWTVPGLDPLRFYAQYGSTRKCPLILLGRGAAFLIDGRPAPFDPNALNACMREGRGYSMAYDLGVRRQSTADALTFLRRHVSR